jgi:hypothetical protein
LTSQSATNTNLQTLVKYIPYTLSIMAMYRVLLTQSIISMPLFTAAQLMTFVRSSISLV